MIKSKTLSTDINYKAFFSHISSLFITATVRVVCMYVCVYVGRSVGRSVGRMVGREGGM